MHLEKLSLVNFRNFEALNLDFSDGLNFFYGQNGQGKTNLLEAIHLLLQGESFRYGDIDSFRRHGSNSAKIYATVNNDIYHTEFSLNLTEKTKRHQIDGKNSNLSLSKDRAKIVLFSPESLLIIKESSDQRRQLIDDFLIDLKIENARVVKEFRSCLRTRNKILKDCKEKADAISHNLLAAITPIFVEKAISLIDLRLKLIREIEPYLNNAMRKISGSNQTELSMKYLISQVDASAMSPEQIREILTKRIEALMPAELASGVSLAGPQRHEIQFLYNQKDSRFFCSQGQQRAIILAFKIAQIVYHKKVFSKYPILLLDDVMSELDDEKKLALISFLKEIHAQVFLTSTSHSIPDQLGFEKSKTWSVCAGQVN